MKPNPRDQSLEYAADRLVREERLLPAGGPIVVAVSGGPDSVALYHFLAATAVREGIDSTVIVAHVNHGLRGAESDADAGFVRSLAAKWGHDYRESTLAPLPASEEAARLARYAALRELAGAVGADRVFTAHTADDQVETVLFRLLRGSGLRGLAGMPVRGRVRGVRIVRPFLTTTREQVLDYVGRNELRYRVDSTNESREPTRNFLRLEILPRIRARVNASANGAILRAAAAVREAEEYLSAESRRLLPSVLRVEGEGKIALDAAGLLDYPKLLRTYLFRDAVQELNGDVRNLSSVHIDALLSLVTTPSRRSVDLPGGIRAWREQGSVRLEHRIPESAGPKTPSKTGESRRPCR